MAIWLSSAGRRHDSPAQLAHGLFEYISVLPDAFRRKSLEADAPSLRAVVVTRHAVLLHGSQLRFGCLLGRCTLRSGECMDDKRLEPKQAKVPADDEEHREEDEHSQQSFTRHDRFQSVSSNESRRPVINTPRGFRTRDARTRPDSPSARRIPWSAALPPPRPARAPCSAVASAGRKWSHTSRTAP